MVVYLSDNSELVKVLLIPVCLLCFGLKGNTFDPKTKRRSERATAGSASGRKTRLGETGRGRNGGSRPEPTPAERGQEICSSISFPLNMSINVTSELCFTVMLS